VFAVIEGTAEQPAATYLQRTAPFTPALDALVAPVQANEAYRLAAPCAADRCRHFDGAGQQCRLVQKTVRLAQVVVRKLPRCAIRTSCRWWHQEGSAACLRCPQVVTLNYAASEAMRWAADPERP
jgi:hypothetical protein